MPDTVPWQAPVSQALTRWALDQLRHPLGAIVRDTVEGVPVVGRIECHFSYGAHPDQPGRWHKGTTLYHPAPLDPATGHRTPLRTPPEGWPGAT